MNFGHLSSLCALSPAWGRSVPTLPAPSPPPSRALLCAHRSHAPRMAYVHGASAQGWAPAEWRGRGSINYPPSRASQIGESPGDAGESGANAGLGGGPLGAPHGLALMLLTSCVFGREKKTPRDAAAWLRPSLARSLLAPSLFCSLPPFANIGFKPAQDSAQRKAAGSRRAAAGAAASPAAAARRDTAASRCTTPPAGSSSPPQPPCSSSQVPGTAGVCCAGDGDAEPLEQEGRGGGRRAQGGRRECELRVRERGAWLCARAHTPAHSHARSCWQHGVCSLVPAMRSGELGSSLHRAARRGAAVTAKGTDGH